MQIELEVIMFIEINQVLKYQYSVVLLTCEMQNSRKQNGGEQTLEGEGPAMINGCWVTVGWSKACCVIV